MLQSQRDQFERGSDNSTQDGRSLWPSAASVPPPRMPATPTAAPGALAPSRVSIGLLALTASLALAAFAPSTPLTSPVRDRAEVRINGAPSHKETSSGRAVAWQRSAVTVTLDPSLEQVGPGIDAVRSAFGAWLSTQARLPAVSFDVTPAAGMAQRDGVNRVLVAPIEIPGHQKDLSIAISYTDEATGELLEVDIVLNSNYAWKVLPEDAQNTKGSASVSGKCAPGTYDLQDIATHEAGHFFGLGEDRDDAQSTMYFESGSCEVLKRDLESSDEQALVAHYERAAEEQEATMACSVSTGSRRSFGGLAMAFVALALLGRRLAMRR